MAADWDNSEWEVGDSSGSISVAEGKKGLDARQENGSILQEMRSFIESITKTARGISIMGNFNVRVGEVVGDKRMLGMGEGSWKGRSEGLEQPYWGAYGIRPLDMDGWGKEKC